MTGAAQGRDIPQSPDAAQGRGEDWSPRTAADLFGLDPADPPVLSLASHAPLGVTVVVPTHSDPPGSRIPTLLATLRAIARDAQRIGLPLTVLVAADRPAADDLETLRHGLARLGCPAELVTLGPGTHADPPSAARTRNSALTALASLPDRSPLRLRHLLFLDDDSLLTVRGIRHLAGVLERAPAAIAACPRVVPVAALSAWSAPDPARALAEPLPGPWRDGTFDLLSVTSHGSLVSGRAVGLLVRTEPLLAWIGGGGRLFCPRTPRGSAEDMLAAATLAKLGAVLAVPGVQAADQARGTPAQTRGQQLRWGYDHAWLVRALCAVGLLPRAVHGLVRDRRHGWQEIRVEAAGATGILVDPDHLTVLSGMLGAAAADRETADALAGADGPGLAEAAAAMARTLLWWRDSAASGERRPRADLPDRMPADWSTLRDGLDSQLAHIAGNALGSARSGLNDAGLPRHLLFGLRQRTAEGARVLIPNHVTTAGEYR